MTCSGFASLFRIVFQIIVFPNCLSVSDLFALYNTILGKFVQISCVQVSVDTRQGPRLTLGSHFHFQKQVGWGT